ncbi:DUF1800 family protein [Tibeticola sp.]|jgi:uncharacterized protein (DUF1800 family)|uniref:DUF1800 domain-containing protein n=1 Tax=Tibeticola sp. TaxID=2005368 RepID=UPI002583EB6D|nr:DUF1800 family protein [Tibeticola sp.]MCI4440845.1 DUF1800 family protein [Tibeticola sp.]
MEHATQERAGGSQATTEAALESGIDPAVSPRSWAGRAGVGLGLLGALAACGGGGPGEGAGGGAGGGSGVPAPDGSGYAYLSATSDADAARFLQQAQFASTRSAIADLRRGSYADWLQRQFASPQGSTAWDWLDAQGYGVVDDHAYYFSRAPADFAIWSQLLSGEDAMRRRMALALSEFFVVSTPLVSLTWPSHAMAHWWDTLVTHAFGNFRTLLQAVTLNPAMGVFLNTRGNQKEDGKGRQPDENYAREVMQLFTIGLYELHADGTLRTGSDGKPIETYDAADVSNLARVFTGYDFDYAGDAKVAAGQSMIYPRDYTRRPMKLNPSRHSTLPVRFLATDVPNTDGAVALQRALDVLFFHPNVGPFFARQMIQRLVTSNPSPAYVARVAARFNDNGQGVRGDLRAVWSAILLDDEARGPQSLADPSWGKLREPMLRFIQWAQSFGARSKTGTWKLGDLSDPATRLGQSPLRAPSVFNFFRPGYVPPGTAMAQAQATAPEFQIVTESSVGGYLNFMQGVVRNGLLNGDLSASYAEELALVADADALLRHVALVLAAAQVSEANHALMRSALEATPVTASSSDAAKLNRVAAAVFMTMASADYLVQR